MDMLDLDTFNDMLERSPVKSKLKKELRFVAHTAAMSDQDWADREMIGIGDKSGNKGVLIIANQGNTYILPYELKQGLSSNLSGQAQPIICDFCRTWQSGARAGSITFTGVSGSRKSISFLCCADLQCSRHVRSMTSSARTSRSQLREDLTDEKRVQRLNDRLSKILTNLGVAPIISHT